MESRQVLPWRPPAVDGRVGGLGDTTAALAENCRGGETAAPFGTRAICAARGGKAAGDEPRRLPCVGGRVGGLGGRTPRPPDSWAFRSAPPTSGPDRCPPSGCPASGDV